MCDLVCGGGCGGGGGGGGGYHIDFLLLLVDTCMLLEGADTRYFTVYAVLGY